MSVALVTQQGIQGMSQNSKDPDELLSSRQAAKELSGLWGHPVTLAAFRMLRFRRKDDPNMPKPAFADGDMVLWRRGDLAKITPPKQRKPEPESPSDDEL